VRSRRTRTRAYASTSLTNLYPTDFRAVEHTDATIGDPIAIVIPTGAMGNIAAGELARTMGLPISKFCACVNSNDITHRVISRGEFWKAPIVRTLSEAINIQVPYNFERLLHFASGDPAVVRSAMEQMASTGKLSVSPVLHATLQARYSSAVVTDSEMLSTMREARARYGYVADPHCAIALAGAQKIGLGFDSDPHSATRGAAVAVVVLATAHPCKFEEAVRVGLGDQFWDHEMVLPSTAAALHTLPEVGGLAAGRLFVAGATDSVGVPLDAAPGGKWEHRLRGLIAGTEAGGFGQTSAKL
jgi:threonine synthase